MPKQQVSNSRMTGILGAVDCMQLLKPALSDSVDALVKKELDHG